MPDQGLLAQIEQDVLDDAVSLTVLLRKCLLLGARSGSEKLREWANRELDGYVGAPELPAYRKVGAVMMVHLTNTYGYNGRSDRLQPSALPKDIFTDVDIEVATMSQGVGELEALLARDEQEHKFVPHWGSVVVDFLEKYATDEDTRVQAVYWIVYKASIQGVLSRVRTALVSLVAELVMHTPPDQALPPRAAVDQAVRVAIYGDNNTVNVQHAINGSSTTNTTTSGEGASVVGHQVVDGDHATLVGRDSTAAKDLAKESWWSGTRKRGVLITLGAGAGVIGAAAGVFTWLGWAPWSP